jgi:spore maturation protein SpmA
VLNVIWLLLVFISVSVALFKLLWLGDAVVFSALVEALFAQAKKAFEIALGYSGLICLWMGLMNIGQHSGLIDRLALLLAPLFRRLMPEVPEGHPAQGAMLMNIAANLLGLDNAATPLGIKAMQALQTLNPHPDRASNAQIVFLVMNTSALTLFPVTIFAFRAQLGAAQATDVFMPILMATAAASATGLLSVMRMQRINLFDRVLWLYGLCGAALLGALIGYFATLPQAQMLRQSALLSQLALIGLITLFLATAAYRRLDVYGLFIEGAKQGFQTAINIAPYLVAMLVAFGLFRASGALDLMMQGVRGAVGYFGMDSRFVDAMPTALIKPFSGSGARALMIETMQTHGADSFAGRLACVIQGSTETTFYVLAVYFGSVGITKTRYTALCGILADIGGVTAAVAVTYWFFG